MSEAGSAIARRQSHLALLRREAYAAFALTLGGATRHGKDYRQLGGLLDEALRALDAHPSWRGHESTAPAGVSLSEAVESTEEVEAEFFTLFYGPGRLMAPPYESVYRSGARQVMGPAARHTLLAYEEAGFRLRDTYRDSQDHVAAQLELMAHLCDASERGSSSSNAQDLARRFLREHLLGWIPAFCADIRRHATTQFWRDVARALEGFLHADALVLDQRQS